MYATVKQNLFSRTHEQTKLIKETLRGKNLFIVVHTSKYKTTKEFVEENLVMCAALKFRHILTRLIWFSQDDIIRRTVFHFIFFFRSVSAGRFVVYMQQPAGADQGCAGPLAH